MVISAPLFHSQPVDYYEYEEATQYDSHTVDSRAHHGEDRPRVTVVSKGVEPRFAGLVRVITAHVAGLSRGPCRAKNKEGPNKRGHG